MGDVCDGGNIVEWHNDHVSIKYNREEDCVYIPVENARWLPFNHGVIRNRYREVIKSRVRMDMANLPDCIRNVVLFVPPSLR